MFGRLEEVVKKSGMENTSERIRELEDELKTMKEKLEQRPLLRQMAFENDQLKKEIKKFELNLLTWKRDQKSKLLLFTVVCYC